MKLGAADYFIKIHYSFISHIPGSQGDAAIASGLISIGQSFNSKVIAVGVETETQFKFLKSKDCDMVQGFYFFHPLPEDELAEVLKKG